MNEVIDTLANAADTVVNVVPEVAAVVENTANYDGLITGLFLAVAVLLFTTVKFGMDIYNAKKYGVDIKPWKKKK